MHTTACDGCRKLRIKCIRPSAGRDPGEVCERCADSHTECITTKRRVGRQLGSKNRVPGKRKLSSADVDADGSDVSGHRFAQARRMHSSSQEPDEGPSSTSTGGAGLGADHFPNPLHVLASEARRLQPHDTSQLEQHRYGTAGSLGGSRERDTRNISAQYAEWTAKVHPADGAGIVARQLDNLITYEQAQRTSTSHISVEEPAVFSGRIDMPRPDAAPEYDVLALEIITLAEAQHLFDIFLAHLSNGSMYLDPRIHTLSSIRARSSFLLAVILAGASTFTSHNASVNLHARLKAHVARLETEIRAQHFKSIEIIQALLLLSNWEEVPATLARESTWMHISHAMALAIELRLDNPLPYCIQIDPMYDPNNPVLCDLLLRNAQRTCFFLYIHDRSMSMVAGRFPLLPEPALAAPDAISRWASHPQAGRFDRGISASVSLRRTIAALQLQLVGAKEVPKISAARSLIDRALSHWRKKWGKVVEGNEYDVISRFSVFVAVSTVLQRQQHAGQVDLEGGEYCETLALEVCCAALNHYKHWPDTLNSATFDTTMVTYCALFIVHAIDSSSSQYLSDWNMFRLAILLELVEELQKQAAGRYACDQHSMSSGDAMARQLSRGIRLLLKGKTTGNPPKQPVSSAAAEQIPTPPPEIPLFEDLAGFTFGNNLMMPLGSDWSLDSFLADGNLGFSDHLNDFALLSSVQ